MRGDSGFVSVKCHLGRTARSPAACAGIHHQLARVERRQQLRVHGCCHASSGAVAFVPGQRVDLDPVGAQVRGDHAADLPFAMKSPGPSIDVSGGQARIANSVVTPVSHSSVSNTPSQVHQAVRDGRR